MTKFELPDLPYAYNALEPYCSAETLELHHSAHHAAYVKGANNTLDRLDEARRTSSNDDINAMLRDLAFHVSGHTLHSLFWANMTPDESKASSDLSLAIDRNFGSLDAFREQLFAASKSLQGSGWAALSYDSSSEGLLVHQIRDHHSNHLVGSQPLLVLDMWEHAYYWQYQNRKKQWIDAFWELLDWQAVSDRYQSVAAGSNSS